MCALGIVMTVVNGVIIGIAVLITVYALRRYDIVPPQLVAKAEGSLHAAPTSGSAHVKGQSPGMDRIKMLIWGGLGLIILILVALFIMGIDLGELRNIHYHAPVE